MKKSVVLYFGSFNPIHRGHTALALCALRELRGDELWFVVSPRSPFKDVGELESESARLEMVELVIAATCDDRLRVCDVEFSMPKPSRTVDTLRLLSRKFPQYTYTLLIGSDNVADFDKWKDYDQILDNYTVAVYPREGDSVQGFQSAETDLVQRFTYLDNMPIFTVSSTKIRECISGGRDCGDWLAGEVLDYIVRENLYGYAERKR